MMEVSDYIGVHDIKVITFVYSRRVRQYVVLSDSKDATGRTTETQRTRRKVCVSRWFPVFLHSIVLTVILLFFWAINLTTKTQRHKDLDRCWLLESL